MLIMYPRALCGQGDKVLHGTWFISHRNVSDFSLINDNVCFKQSLFQQQNHACEKSCQWLADGHRFFPSTSRQFPNELT